MVVWFYFRNFVAENHPNNGIMMIEQFLNYLKFERNYSAKTVDEYGNDLRAFQSYFKNMDAHLTWESVDSDVIRDWMESMMDKGNIATSINRRLSALRSFFRFALSRHLVESDPAHVITGPKKEKPLPQFLKDKEMERLLDERMWNFDNFDDVRARTIISVFYETGIRVAELVGLDDAAVDLDACRLRVTGKRDRQRVIPFGDGLRAELRRYMNLRAEKILVDTAGVLFVTNKGARMQTYQVTYIIKKHLSKVCTLKKRTPHVLRHTFATTMLNHGAELESVKKLLGHRSFSTTEVYTHTTFDQLRKIYDTAHPRA